MSCFPIIPTFSLWPRPRIRPDDLAAIRMADRLTVEILDQGVNLARFFTPYIYGRYEHEGKIPLRDPRHRYRGGPGAIGRSTGGCANPLVRFLIISDIHANWDALDAVLNRAEGKYDLVLNCGDLVGYGPEPNRVVDWCRATNAAVVRGQSRQGCRRLGRSRVVQSCRQGRRSLDFRDSHRREPALSGDITCWSSSRFRTSVWFMAPRWMKTNTSWNPPTSSA